MQVLVTDALDAMEMNIRAFLTIAGEKAGNVGARIDSVSGTASIKHFKNAWTGAIDVEVKFPAMASATRLSKEELDRWTGYFLHELCHALYTDETAWHTAVRERIHVLVNALEDVRIETKFNHAAIAANSTKVLNALLSHCVAALPASYNPNDMKDLPWLLAMAGRVHVCGYNLPEAQAQLDKLSPAMSALVADVMAQVSKAQSTNDILDIVRALKARLAPKPGDKPEGDSGKGDKSKPEGEKQDSAPVDSDSETETADSGAAETVEAQEGDKPEEDSAAPAPVSSGAPNGEQGESGNSAGGSGDSDLTADFDQMRAVEMDPVSDEIKESAQGAKRNPVNASKESVMAEAIRKAQRSAGVARPAMESVWMKEPTASVAALSQNALRAGKLKAQVARVLKAADNETYERNRPSGRLDRSAMARIGAGQTEGVYARRTFSSGYETEITVLLDHSGSMSGAYAWAASTLALTIAQAAQSVGVKNDILSFSSTEFETVKATSETPTLPIVLKRLARLGLTAGGSTPLSSCMISATAKLAARAPNKRKILFVVSDGDCDSGGIMVRKACDYARRMDVETVALCIGIPSHDGFSLAVSCKPDDIASAGLGVLVRALERESA